LRIADTGAWLRIEVSDADPRPPQPHLPAELDESGFGFVLVDALAAKWGVDQATAGKTVWIELDTGRADHSESPPTQNQASSRGGSEQCQARQPGQTTGEVTAAADDDSHQAAGTGGIPAPQTASICRCAAALIHELGWDPLAETCNAAGPLPMDVAIFTVTEARGYDHPDDILDAALTHIAGLLYAAGEITRQTLVHDMTDVAMAWEARPDRTIEEVLAVLDLTPPPSSTAIGQRPQAWNPQLVPHTSSARRTTRTASIDNITLRNSEDEENAPRAADMARQPAPDSAIRSDDRTADRLAARGEQASSCLWRT